jgi:septal ring-binding cell division protein DamX
MVPTDPTWDNTGFEPDPNENEGFAGPRRVLPEPPRNAPTPPKRKSTLYWFAVASALVLLIALIGGGIYWLSQPTAEERAFYTTKDNTPSVTVPSTHDEDVQAPSQMPVDSADVPSVDEHEQAASSVAVEKIEKPRPTVMKKREPDESMPEHSTPTVPPNTEPLPKRTEPAANVAKEPAIKTTASTSGNPLYVIQVFSSPSRDDADEWLQSLLEKNVSNGYITEQKIKGQSWYRVRFGQFATRESAESEAIRLGFREPWIARIR